MRSNVMTFNLKYDSGDNGWDLRVKRIVQVIKEYNPIFIGTQEGLIGMLNDMSELLPEYSWVGKGRDLDTGNGVGEHGAIFYKNEEVKLIEWGQFWLSETPEVEGSTSWNSACTRICTWAHFNILNDNTDVIVYNTHLDHVSVQAREEGIKLIVNFIKEKNSNKEIPFLLMGDFNCYMDDKVFETIKNANDDKFVLRNCYDLVDNNVTCTFHDFRGDQNGGVIDYILCSKEFEVKSIGADMKLIEGGHPSDHYPVIVNLLLN